MQTLKGYAEQLGQAWKNSTPAARLGILLLAVLCGVAIAAVGYWSSLPQYTELVAGLEATEMDSLVSELDRANIRYEIRGVGDTIFVDRASWSIAKGILRGNRGESEGAALGPSQMFPLPDEVRQKELRRRERSLVTAIKKFNGVADAEVTLTVPENTGFLPDKFDTPRAAVSLTLKKGHIMGDSEAFAIAQHVSNSVLGLKPSEVAISDKDGKIYRIPRDEDQGLLFHDQVRSSFEKAMVNKLQSLMGLALGFENVSVRVAADVTVQEKSLTQRRVEAENATPRKEDVRSKKTFSESASDSASSSGGNKGNLVEQEEDTVTEFEVGNSTSTTSQHELTINRLTISVMANANSPLLTGDKPLTEDELKSRIENIVKGASGFKEDRDYLSVVMLPFPGATETGVTPAAFPWEQINKILQNVSLGIAAIIAFVIAFLALRKLQAVPGTGGGAPQLSQENSNRVTQLGQLITQNPEVFSRIIAAWAEAPSGNSPNSAERSNSERKAA